MRLALQPCRKYAAKNPLTYLAPVTVDSRESCICFERAEARNWLDGDGNLRPGIEL